MSKTADFTPQQFQDFQNMHVQLNLLMKNLPNH